MIYQFVSHTDNSVVMTRFTGMSTNQVYTSASTDYVVYAIIINLLSYQFNAMVILPSRAQHDDIVVIVSSATLQ